MKLSALLVRCILPLTILAASAEAFGQAAPAVNGPSISRFEIYGGYGYFHPFSSDIHNIQYPVIPAGGIAGINGYFNRFLGLQIEGSASPNAYNDNNCVYTAQAGPVLRYQKGRFVPYFHALGGAAEQGGPANQPCGVWGWGTTTGFGFDYILPILHDHLALRPLQADYTYSHIDNGPLAPNGLSGGLGKIYSYRLGAGLVFRFGNVQAEQSATMTCSANPAEAYPGDPVTVSATVMNIGAIKDLTYRWTSTAAQLTGGGAMQTIDTTNVQPGSYSAAALLVAGRKAHEVATCSADFKVLDTEPPTVSCSANRTSINSGDQVIVTASARSPQNLGLTYAYDASNGQIVGVGPTATLSTTGATPGAITVTCKVVDAKGKSASANTSVVVATPPPPPPAPEARSLCGVSFDRDRKRPVRVDNEAKGCLDDIALTMNRETDAKLQIIGNRAPGEPESFAASRARNVGEYLVREKGIDPSRLDLRQGNEPSRTVTTTLLPPGTTK